MTQLETLHATGIRRLGSPRAGFRYRHANGRPASRQEVERIRALKLPPAWKEVRINPRPSGALQAVGRDAAGRWQYRYGERAVRRREERKYRRLVAFAEALPRLRRRIRQDLRRPGLGRDKVLACVLRVLTACFMRPGSEIYARENNSFGVATLRSRHVTVRGDRVRFDFPGKSGKQHVRELRDRQVAKIVRQLLKIPGRDVFKFVTEDGDVVDVRRRHINAYVKEVMGEQFSAKDFRTWAGTLICASELARSGFSAEEPPRLRRKKVVAAVKATAEQLGNTPAICRSSYIYPSVLTSFDRGRVIERYFESAEELSAHDRQSLHGTERALLDLIRDDATTLH